MPESVLRRSLTDCVKLNFTFCTIYISKDNTEKIINECSQV